MDAPSTSVAIPRLEGRPPVRKGRPPDPPWKAITIRLPLPVIEALRQRGPTVTRAATDLLKAALAPKETP